METIRHQKLILITLVILGIFFVSGCGTTSRGVKEETPTDENADIDALLGLTDKRTDTKTDKQKDETIAEDDVLKLLGVVEEGKTDAVQAKSKDENVGLKEEVQKLEDKQAALDTKEKTLQEDLLKQKETIDLLQKDRDASTRGLPATGTEGWKSSSFDGRYQEARQDYLARRYREALQKFEALLEMNAKHSLSDNCQYWIGECYYGLGQYRQAILAFERVFFFAQSNKDDAAQLKLGLCYMRLDDKEMARRELQKLVDNYPTSEFISTAKRYLTQIE